MPKRQLKLCLLGVFPILCLVFVGSLHADAVLTYGTLEGNIRIVELVQNQSGQAVQFFVSGLAAEGGADGFEMDLQIRDGGAANGGTANGPVFQSVDLITGTIWATRSPTQNNVVVSPLLRQSTVDTTSRSTSDGLVATVVFDTSGFGPGDYSFRLSGVADGTFNSKFFGGATAIPTTAPNGILRVVAVPEPSGLIFVSSLIGFALRRVRK